MPNIFPSCYQGTGGAMEPVTAGCVYPVGFDWAWADASNDIEFTNSFKMKFAVIVGVLHMSLGLCVKGLNAIYFRQWGNFFFEFLPQLVFLLSIFGYMCFAIILKWVTNWDGVAKPPQIINMMIYFVTDVEQPLWGNPEQQLHIQRVLASKIFFLLTNKVTAMCCIPIMLIVKPMSSLCGQWIHEKLRSESEPTIPQEYQKMAKNTSIILEDQVINDSDDEGEALCPEDKAIPDQQPEEQNPSDQFPSQHAEKQSFGEVMIHQTIETIEFILGTISNTASYLRLWALSLAHSQLAKVFYEMLLEGHIIRGGSLIGSTIGVIFGFFMLAAVTFVI
jgi:V-type H+-transporting ATPase subunit a